MIKRSALHADTASRAGTRARATATQVRIQAREDSDDALLQKLAEIGNDTDHPSESGRRDATERLLTFESQQAWEHYRHVENQRNQYLAFFFTLVTAAFGIVLGTNLQKGVNGGLAVTLDAGVSAIVSAMGFLVYSCLLQFRIVLEFYSAVIVLARNATIRINSLDNSYSTDGSEFVVSWDMRLNVRNYLPEQVIGRYRSPQATAEFGVGVVSCLTMLAPSFLLISIDYMSLTRADLAVISILALLGLLLFGDVQYRWLSMRRIGIPITRA